MVEAAIVSLSALDTGAQGNNPLDAYQQVRVDCLEWSKP
jgi:hypothetical protein